MKRAAFGIGTGVWLGLAVALGSTAACGGSSEAEPTESKSCTPGEVVPCRCLDGKLSEAVCEIDSIFGACACAAGEPEGEGGSVAGGGSGPTGGTTASGGKGGDEAVGGTNGEAGAAPNGSVGGAEPDSSVAGAATEGGASGAGPGEEEPQEPLPLGVCVDALLSQYVVDAEFSYSLNRIVALTSSPSAVTLIDPSTAGTKAIALPLAGSSISVAPSGHLAAVAHDGYVSIIDLKKAKLTTSIPTTTVAGDVVMTDKGFAYVLPESDQWVDIHSIDIAAEQDFGNENHWSIYAGTLAKLHPGGNFAYGITQGLSPTDVERYDVSNGVVSNVVDSPYHGDYTMCGDLFFTKDGARMITGCGTAFRSAPGEQDDFLYSGSFEDDGTPNLYGRVYASIEHDPTNGSLYALRSAGFYNDTLPDHAELEVYSDDYLAAKPVVPLPCIEPFDTQFPNGRFVFAASDGKQVYVLARTKVASSNSWVLAVSTRE
jgi:hypothetical protein